MSVDQALRTITIDVRSQSSLAEWGAVCSGKATLRHCRSYPRVGKRTMSTFTLKRSAIHEPQFKTTLFFRHRQNLLK